MPSDTRAILRQLILDHGRTLATDPRRCEAMLRDLCADQRREVNLLSNALREQIAADLLVGRSAEPVAMRLARLSRRLEDHLSLKPEAAAWAVETWALVLGVIEHPLPVAPAARVARVARVVPAAPVARVVPAAPAAPVAQELTVAGRRYLLYPDGTATDTQTGLMWMRCSLGQTWDGTTCLGEAKKMNWEEAMKQTGGGFAGYSDWRLPTIEELRTLFYCSSGKPKTWNDTGKSCEGDFQSPTIALAICPNTPRSWFWSSSPVAGYADGAWDVFFGNGSDGNHGKGGVSHVRLVRGGQ